MSDKSLSDKAIDIKGKKYVQVKDRVQYLADKFDEDVENGYSVEQTYKFFPDQRMWVVKTTLRYRGYTYDGLAQEVESDDYKSVNNASALENCATSSLGRAIACIGIGVQESFASANEMNKQPRQVRFATEKQIKWIRDTAHEVNDQLGDDEETDAWIESILTIKPSQVPIFKVKDAVDKLKQPEPSLPDPDIEMTEEQLNEAMAKIESGDLPY